MSKVCKTCKEEKEDSDYRTTFTGHVKLHCRACEKKYNRNKYLKDREKRISRQLVTNAKRKADYQEYMTSYYLDNPCADCGTTDFRVFENDHVHGAKRWDIAAMVTCSRESLISELAKTEVVCANCHRIRTMTRGDHWRIAAYEDHVSVSQLVD